ncbi:MAG: DUF1289 domain-containing protein [Pseudomonadota bacterium]
MARPPAVAVRSPCVGVCRMDPATGWCEGCLRTIDEIASWSSLSDEDKRAVWVRLRERRHDRRAQARNPASGGTR